LEKGENCKEFTSCFQSIRLSDHSILNRVNLKYKLLKYDIDVRREELDGLFRPLENGQAEIIIYDNVPGGAGYSQRIADNFKDILMATTSSMIYLPQLIDPFCLDRGEPMAWLNKLSDMVKKCNPLTLILHELPQPVSDHNLVLRKRLSQWIDQGLLKLYQTDIDKLPTLYLQTSPQNCVALGLHQESENQLVWLQTCSQEGVHTIQKRLNDWLVYAIEVQLTELEDANTQVIFP
jgi:hypothetical protein